jgi:hypothetical protein
MGAAAGVAAHAAAGTRPNSLHIMTDQQQWATIMGRSECRTPHLDKLAKSGLSFERSYPPSAVCCPARAMMLSGVYHWHNGVYNQVHSPPSVHRDSRIRGEPIGRIRFAIARRTICRAGNGYDLDRFSPSAYLKFGGT